MKKILLGFLLLLAVTPKELVQIKPQLYVDMERDISIQETTCLAQNIFYEAVGEPRDGQIAVAMVTMNRVHHSFFPNTICEVVYQRNSRGCQFSWTCGPKTKFNQQRYIMAYEIAEKVLTKELYLSRLKNALYFHSVSVSPNWDFAEPITQIGNHIFYKVIPYESRIAQASGL